MGCRPDPNPNHNPNPNPNPKAVRAAQRGLGEPHAAINHIFHDVVQWKVHGFSA